VVISNVQCLGNNLSAYDIVYNDIDKSTMDLFKSTFEEKVNFNILGELKKQKGIVDCGMFSIASAASLLHGLSPV